MAQSRSGNYNRVIRKILLEKFPNHQDYIIEEWKSDKWLNSYDNIRADDKALIIESELFRLYDVKAINTTSYPSFNPKLIKPKKADNRKVNKSKGKNIRNIEKEFNAMDFI
jgi:hypothetical protein